MATIDIRSMYHIANKTGAGSYGIDGYHVDKKYLDPNKIKEEKLYSSKDKPPATKPMNVTDKKTFIDEVQKKSARLPGPSTYQPKQYQSKSKTESVIKRADRKTIFDQVQQYNKKYNFPAPVKYSKVLDQIDKSKLKSNMSKAQNANYVQSSMRNSIERPGVGNYNNRSIFAEIKRGSRWVEGKSKSKSQAKTKLPPVGTYDPKPVEFSLFASIGDGLTKKKSQSYFGKSQRFKPSKQKQIPYYNILSQWGLKDKGHKKDILYKVTKTAGVHSVYY